MVKVPEKCMVCGANWRGGSAPPGEPITPWERGSGGLALYECGGKMWIMKIEKTQNLVFFTLMVRCGTDAK